MANPLAYYDTTTFTAVKSFIVQAPADNYTFLWLGYYVINIILLSLSPFVMYCINFIEVLVNINPSNNAYITLPIRLKKLPIIIFYYLFLNRSSTVTQFYLTPNSIKLLLHNLSKNLKKNSNIGPNKIKSLCRKYQ